MKINVDLTLIKISEIQDAFQMTADKQLSDSNSSEVMASLVVKKILIFAVNQTKHAI
jgi:hypothetical protein